MRRNSILCRCFIAGRIAACMLLFLPAWLNAQDPLPAPARPLEPLRLPDDTEGIHRGMKLIAVHDSLPAGFTHTSANRIEDECHSLDPFFDKLTEQSAPVRVVHIGDSHVRGHVYPLITRRRLEADFGDEAVFPDTISYRTAGLAHETGAPGIVYHILGVNGATNATFATEEKVNEVAALNPDLIILSFGTNEAHSRRYSAPVHQMQLDHLLAMLKEACPEAAFLFTTPPGAYAGRRRARIANPRTATVARTIREYARAHRMAVWDMYTIIGGRTDACKNWTKYRLLRADGIHFTPEGYRLQGNLLHQALIKAYNEYVAIRLE